MIMDSGSCTELVTEPERLDRDAVLALVDDWAVSLGVNVNRQLRRMRNKWGSISSAGNLTLATDVLELPRDLVEYVIVHELLHLRVPRHDRLFRVLLGRYLPDHRRREAELSRRIVRHGNLAAIVCHRPDQPKHEEGNQI